MAKKKAAKKAAAPAAKSEPKGVRIALVGSQHGATDGEERTVPKATADKLVRRGHARLL